LAATGFDKSPDATTLRLQTGRRPHMLERCSRKMTTTIARGTAGSGASKSWHLGITRTRSISAATGSRYSCRWAGAGGIRVGWISRAFENLEGRARPGEPAFANVSRSGWHFSQALGVQSGFDCYSNQSRIRGPVRSFHVTGNPTSASAPRIVDRRPGRKNSKTSPPFVTIAIW
jgi:hypothetical protein